MVWKKSNRNNLRSLETRLLPMNDCIESRSAYASSLWSFRPQDSRRSLSSCFCCFSRDRCSCSSVSMRWKSSGCMGLLGCPLRVLVTSDVAKNKISTQLIWYIIVPHSNLWKWNKPIRKFELYLYLSIFYCSLYAAKCCRNRHDMIGYEGKIKDIRWKKNEYNICSIQCKPYTVTIMIELRKLVETTTSTSNLMQAY